MLQQSVKAHSPPSDSENQKGPSAPLDRLVKTLKLQNWNDMKGQVMPPKTEKDNSAPCRKRLNVAIGACASLSASTFLALFWELPVAWADSAIELVPRFEYMVVLYVCAAIALAAWLSAVAFVAIALIRKRTRHDGSDDKRTISDDLEITAGTNNNAVGENANPADNAEVDAS